MNYQHIPSGDYYDCRCDCSEALKHETPADAVVGFMDGFGVSGESISDTLKRIGDITVSVYRREEVGKEVSHHVGYALYEYRRIADVNLTPEQAEALLRTDMPDVLEVPRG